MSKPLEGDGFRPGEIAQWPQIKAAFCEAWKKTQDRRAQYDAAVAQPVPGPIKIRFPSDYKP